MLPSNSNLNKENCSSTSSNCVVWQGPDIPAINLCNGDSVSEVIYKLGEEILILQENIGVSGVELDQLVKVCQLSPTPSKTLANILDLLIEKVICIDEVIKDLPPPGTNYQEPTLFYPVCPAFDGLVNAVHRDYTIQLAQKICSLTTTVNGHTNTLATYGVRITDLEAKFPIPKLQLQSCLSGGAVIDYDDLLQNLETEFCDIKEALGDEGLLNSAKNKQCTNLSSQKQLVNSTLTMSAIPGWVGVPQTFAESVQNLWLTVCDMRAAVRQILDNCCKAGCDDILIDAYIKWKDDGSDIVLMNFKAKSKLPIGFYDCGQSISLPNVTSHEFILTDSAGMQMPLAQTTLFRSIDPLDKSGWLDDIITWPSGWVEWDLASLGLNLSAGPIVANADLCFTDGTIQCIKCVQFTIPPKPADKCCEIKATGDVTIIYSTC